MKIQYKVKGRVLSIIVLNIKRVADIIVAIKKLNYEIVSVRGV